MRHTIQHSKCHIHPRMFIEHLLCLAYAGHLGAGSISRHSLPIWIAVRIPYLTLALALPCVEVMRDAVLFYQGQHHAGTTEHVHSYYRPGPPKHDSSIKYLQMNGQHLDALSSDMMSLSEIKMQTNFVSLILALLFLGDVHSVVEASGICQYSVALSTISVFCLQ